VPVDDKNGAQSKKSDESPAAPKIAHDVDKKDRSSDVRVTGEHQQVDFKGMQLSEEVLKGLTHAGFLYPSPIQHRAIPYGKCGFGM